MNMAIIVLSPLISNKGQYERGGKKDQELD
jgi:hypothetical protein